nr:unnamed protein product [Digitaria exilis]
MHLLPIISIHGFPYHGRQLVAPHLAADLHPNAPLGALLVCCSAKKGQLSIGTPPQRLSSVEFHPECVRNTPTASCCSTAACWHHVVNSARPSTADTNSGGSTAESPFTRSLLMFHTNA